MDTFLESLGPAQAIGAAVLLVVAAGLVGLAIDAVSGLSGWWLALGSLGLCFAALLLAAVSSRRPVR